MFVFTDVLFGFIVCCYWLDCCVFVAIVILIGLCRISVSSSWFIVAVYFALLLRVVSVMMFVCCF